MSVLDPKSARARLLALVVLETGQSTWGLARQIKEQRPGRATPNLPRREPTRAPGYIRTSRLRASYALAWLRRSGMVERSKGEVFVDGPPPGWEATEHGRAVLRSMLAEVHEPAEAEAT